MSRTVVCDVCITSRAIFLDPPTGMACSGFKALECGKWLCRGSHHSAVIHGGKVGDTALLGTQHGMVRFHPGLRRDPRNEWQSRTFRNVLLIARMEDLAGVALHATSVMKDPGIHKLRIRPVVDPHSAYLARLREKGREISQMRLARCQFFQA